MKTIKDLEPIPELSNDDLLLIWDTSDHNRRVELQKVYGANENLPSSSKNVSVNDLIKFISDAVIANVNKQIKL